MKGAFFPLIMGKSKIIIIIIIIKGQFKNPINEISSRHLDTKCQIYLFVKYQIKMAFL